MSRSAVQAARSALVSRDATRRPSWLAGLALPLALGTLAGAFMLVMLRTDIVRLRYARAQLLEQEQKLRHEQNTLKVELRELRQPGRLAALARERGFAPPERVIHVDRAGATRDAAR